MKSLILPLLATTLVAAPLVGCATTPGSRPPPPPAPAESDGSHIEAEVFQRVNAARAEAGIPGLQWSEELAALARGHSEAMASGRIPFGHAGMGERLRSARALRGSRHAAENVSLQPRAATEVAAASVERWRASGPHERNLLGPFAATGVGVAGAADGRFFVTQIFVE